MRIVAALALLAACGSPGKPSPALPSGEAPDETAYDTTEISNALRAAELRADGTALIEREGEPAPAGARYVVATLDGARIVTVELGRAIDTFLDYDDTQVFLVCTDSRGGEPPALYEATVVEGSAAGLTEPVPAVAWPAELDLRFLDGAVRGGGVSLAVTREDTMEGEQFRLGERGVYVYHCAY